MTEAPHTNESEPEHEGLIKTPKQLILLVFLAFAVPIFFFQLLAHLVASEPRPSAGSNAMQPDEIVARIKQVGHVEINANAAEPEAAASAATPAVGEASAAASAKAALASVASATATPVAAKSDAGKPPALYAQVCFACHSTGAAGAPKLGDKAAWAPRLKLGIDGLTATAIKGIGAMPPRGGSNASDAEIKAVVEYMVHDVQ